MTRPPTRTTRALLGAMLLAALVACLSPAPATASHNEELAVRQLVSLATSSPSYDQRDRMLLDGAVRFQETESFLVLASAAVYDSTRNRILSIGAGRARSVRDCIALAAKCPGYDVRDRLLLEGERLAMEPADFLALAGACVYDSTKNSLLRKGLRICRRASDFVALATRCPGYDVRDTILLAGAQVLRGVDELLTLQGACVYDSAKVKILRAAIRDACSVEDVVRVATLSPAAAYDARDEMLLAGVRFCRSAEEAQHLASQAVYDSTRNRILREYAQMAGFASIHGR